MKIPGPLVRVQAVEPLEDFVVRITFKDGVQKEIDLRKFLRGEIFEPIRTNPEMFRSVKVIGEQLAGTTAQILTLMFYIMT